MAVVINEFEVVPNESAKQSATPSPAQTDSPATPEPQQIEQLIERERERCARIWAH